jgi:hypothetical protein
MCYERCASVRAKRGNLRRTILETRVAGLCARPVILSASEESPG